MIASSNLEIFTYFVLLILWTACWLVQQYHAPNRSSTSEKNNNYQNHLRIVIFAEHCLCYSSNKYKNVDITDTIQCYMICYLWMKTIRKRCKRMTEWLNSMLFTKLIFNAEPTWIDIALYHVMCLLISRIPECQNLQWFGHSPNNTKRYQIKFLFIYENWSVLIIVNESKLTKSMDEIMYGMMNWSKY